MNQEEYMFAVSRKRVLITVPIMILGIAGVFFVGLHFDIFESKIDFIRKPSNYLFFGSMLLSAFGAFYTFVSLRKAMSRTIILGILFAFLYLGGKFFRGEL